MIRTESGLIALEEGTVVVDSAGSEWVREEREQEWQGMDVPYPVLVDTGDNWVEFLDDNPYMPSTVALDYGPFKVKETTGDSLDDWAELDYALRDVGPIFDRWRADFKRKIAAKTLRDFADDPDVFTPAINEGEFVMGINYSTEYMKSLARTRADRIEQGDDQ